MKHEIPMKRQSDNTVVGTLTVVRAADWSFVHPDGTRRVNPAKVDSIIINVTNTKGETVGYAAIPMDQLPASD